MKTEQIILNPIYCPKGHKFYPKVLSDGTIKQYEKCIIRSCRSLLDIERIKLGKLRQLENLKIKHKPNYKPKNTKKIIYPYCNICKLTFYDIKNFQQHNKRLHK